MNYYECEFNNETIILARPNEGVTLVSCVFRNCHFFINKPSYVYLNDNKYYNCTFELDFSSCTDDIELYHDGILQYPEVREYIDKLIPSKCPKNKDFYGYKILYNEFTNKYFLAKLQIDAKTPTANNGIVDKCRAEKAKVISIYSIKPLKTTKSVFHICFNSNGQNIEYTIGHTVYANKWDSDRFNVCTGGIHFYLDPIKALQFQRGCGKELAKEIVFQINKTDPDFYQIEER